MPSQEYITVKNCNKERTIDDPKARFKKEYLGKALSSKSGSGLIDNQVKPSLTRGLWAIEARVVNNYGQETGTIFRTTALITKEDQTINFSVDP